MFGKVRCWLSDWVRRLSRGEAGGHRREPGPRLSPGEAGGGLDSRELQRSVDPEPGPLPLWFVGDVGGNVGGDVGGGGGEAVPHQVRERTRVRPLTGHNVRERVSSHCTLSVTILHYVSILHNVSDRHHCRLSNFWLGLIVDLSRGLPDGVDLLHELSQVLNILVLLDLTPDLSLELAEHVVGLDESPEEKSGGSVEFLSLDLKL